MPVLPNWAYRFLVYIMVGLGVVVVLPVLAWIGKREILRWEKKVSKLEDEVEKMRQEREELKGYLENILDEVQS